MTFHGMMQHIAATGGIDIVIDIKSFPGLYLDRYFIIKTDDLCNTLC